MMTDRICRLSHYIDGKAQLPAGGSYFDNVYPFTGEVTSQIAQGNAQDVDAAVTAASRAFREGD